MSEPVVPPTSHPIPEPTPVLEPDRVPLDGWLERQKFAPWLTALFATVTAWIGFQFIGALVSIALVMARDGAAALENPAELLTGHLDLVMIGNTVGQVLGLGLFALLLARWHSSRPLAFLRVMRFDVKATLLSILGLILLLPVVQWLGEFNSTVPLPPALEELERQQLEMIESLLRGETGFLFNLMALAVTPAICEELFFRGYLQRQVERTGGVVWGIVLTGVVFGLYHLRLTQVLPLCVLGIYLCWVAWRCGSIVPAVILHFIHNGAALVASAYVVGDPDLDLESLDTALAPWYIVVPSILLFAVVIMYMNQGARRPQNHHDPQIYES